MIEQLINAVSFAFSQVAFLVGGGLHGVFGAVESLSSNFF